MKGGNVTISTEVSSRNYSHQLKKKNINVNHQVMHIFIDLCTSLEVLSLKIHRSGALDHKLYLVIITFSIMLIQFVTLKHQVHYI